MVHTLQVEAGTSLIIRGEVILDLFGTMTYQINAYIDHPYDAGNREIVPITLTGHMEFPDGTRRSMRIDGIGDPATPEEAEAKYHYFEAVPDIDWDDNRGSPGGTD